MKIFLKANYLLGAGAALLLASAASVQGQAATNIVFRFNTSGTETNWVKWWGSAPTTLGFDNSMDAALNPASGAMKVTAGFNYASYGGDNQFALRGTLKGNGNLSGLVVAGTNYDRLEFDLYWDPASPTRAATGDYGSLDVGLVPTDYSQVWFPSYVVTTPGAWVHVSLAISNLDQTKLSQIGGVVLKMWSGDANSAQTGTATFWVDNVKLIANKFITDFDNGNYVNGFWNWWGGATRTVTWDPAVDAGNDTNSGSMYVSVDFSGTGDNQYSEGMSLDGTGSYRGGITLHTPNYTAVNFDLLWDTNSTLDIPTLNTNGDPNGLGIGLASATWGQIWPPNPTQPVVVADGAWHHVSIPLNSAWADISGLIFKKYFGTGTQFSGNMNFWVDNISFTPSAVPPPPPSMALHPAKNGLTLFMAQAGQQYQREAISSVPAHYMQWYNDPNPFTYSLTISQFPDGAKYSGVQCHIILVPDASSGNAVDYSDPNAIMLDIKASAANAGNATFRFKTNQPNANSQMYTSGQGQLGTLNAPNILGKWSLTFMNNTNILVSGPGGVSTNFYMTADQAAMFNSSTPIMEALFGCQPNNAGNIGQSVSISEIKITDGSTVVVDDKFPTPDPTQQVDPTLWELKMDDTAGIFVINQQPSYWLTWTLPDAGFSLMQKANLTDTGVAPGLTPIPDGGLQLVPLGPTMLPDQNQSYFYLLKTTP